MKNIRKTSYYLGLETEPKYDAILVHQKAYTKKAKGFETIQL